MSEYTRKPRSTRRKRAPHILLVLCLMLVVMVGSIAGTVAWLTDSTTPVTNTFTVGDINITLTETTGTTYKIIPGTDITKDPKVTVKANSEACWLFVKVEKSNWNNNKISYTMAEGWTALTGHDGVYYREVNATTADTDFAVIKDNKITVSSDLTKSEVKTIKDAGEVKLTFTAYAVQKENVSTAADAWTKLNPSTVTE